MSDFARMLGMLLAACLIMPSSAQGTFIPGEDRSAEPSRAARVRTGAPGAVADGIACPGKDCPMIVPFGDVSGPRFVLIFLIETGHSPRGWLIVSIPQDFSRRFFDDFIASRIKAWSREEGATRPAGRIVRSASGVTPNPAEPDAVDGVPIDEPGGLIPGLGAAGA